MSFRFWFASLKTQIGLRPFIPPCRANRSNRRWRSIMILTLLSFAALPSADAYPQKTTASYTVTDLGGLPGLSFIDSEARAINDYGEIVGVSYTAGANGREEPHAVVWAKDATGKYVMTDLGRGSATGINNQGDVLANGSLIVPVTVNGSLVWYEDLNGDGINDLAIPLSVGGTAINNETQILSGNYILQFDAAGDEIITTLPGSDYGFAINDQGQVAGEAGIDAAIWQVDAAGNLLSTEFLDPLTGSASATAFCIDGLGRAAGYSWFIVSKTTGAGRSRATVWLNGAAPTDLGAPPRSSSVAKGMNIVNGVLQVVGTIDDTTGSSAFLWKNGTMTSLGRLISASGVSPYSANAINTRGQMVGAARITVGKNDTELHAVLLTPK
jgi:probable HAF family extracellular repeat protein